MTRYWCVAAAVLAAGCGPPRAVAPVSGLVTYQGRPLAGGTVTFVPAPPGPPAVGAVGPDGRYRLTTYSPDDGAVLGPHTVSVTALREEVARADADIGPGPSLAVPPKYTNPKTSGLTAEVRRGHNTVDLKLE